MKNKHFQTLSRCSIGMSLWVILFPIIVLSQNDVAVKPLGVNIKESLVVSVQGDLGQPIFTYGLATVSSNVVNVVRFNKEIVIKLYPWHPPESYIVAAKVVEASGGFRDLKVLLNNGDVYLLDYTKAYGTVIPPEVTKLKVLTLQGGYGETYVKVYGDATYVLSTSFLYVYRDSLSSWKVDSTGLGSAFINDISLDTSQYVYAATSKGVFKQHPDSSVWHQITNLPTSNFASILVDRRNRIFVANYVSYNGKGTYISTNGGSSWTLDSAGIGTRQIQALSDDAYGNTYAIANGSGELYGRKNNTPGWTHIEGGITSITVNPVTFNSVAGDSVLYAATNFGLFASTDQGTTWSEDNANNPATSFYSFAKGAGGKWFTSTDLAVYSLGPTDTAWTKVYPTSGYQAQVPISTDGLGNIYTTSGGQYNYVANKSSNNGSTWTADSVTVQLFSPWLWYVDEEGGQHIATKTVGSGSCVFYAKPLGGSWGLDTAGFQVTNNSNSQTIVLASDKHGYLYNSGTSYIYGSANVDAVVMRKPISGGKWVPDTMGLPSTYHFCNALVPGKNGDMYAEFPPFLVHRSNSGLWSNVKMPVIPDGTLSRMQMSVDSSGALFITTTGQDINYNYRGLGVYFTTDTGATWKYAGLDSIGVNQLISYGDSTYAATNNGLYILTRKVAGATGVQQVHSVPTTYALYQNYPNPFNPTTTIQFSIGKSSIVNLKIFDLLGRQVETLVSGEMSAGKHQVSFDATRYSTGVYFYRIQAGNFTSTKKLVLLK